MKRIKNILALLLVVLFAATSLIGCSTPTNDPDPAKTESPTTAPVPSDPASSEEPLKVALILPGETTDMGWSTQGYNGLLRAQEEFGIEIAYAEKISESDAEEYIRGYANDGYDLVISHSSAYADAVKAVAAAFPDTWFVVTSTNVHEGANMSAYSNDNAEQGFLAGVVAAVCSAGGKVGYIGGKETTPVVQKMNNAKLGATWANESVEYTSIIMGSYDDLQLAQESTTAMIESGVDVIIANADKATTTILDVCKQKGVACVALGDYYSKLYADTQVADVINDAATCVYQAISDFKDGTILADFRLLGTDVNAVFVDNFASFVSADAQALVESAVNELLAKKIELVR